MRHSDYRTTSIYAYHAPDPSHGVIYAAKAGGALAEPPSEPEYTLSEALVPSVQPTDFLPSTGG